MKLDRTFIEGFDDVLGGGVPHGSLVLLVGAPGTMKSSVAYAILHGNAQRGHRGLYVSFEQSRESLAHHVQGLGMDPAGRSDGLSLLDLGLLRKRIASAGAGAWLDLFTMYTASIKAGFDYEFLVLDSLDALRILARFQNPRLGLFKLFRWLRGLGVTAFLVSELPTEWPAAPGGPAFEWYAKYKEDYLADGIVHLKLARQGDFGVRRQVRVVKMRGVRHSTDYHALVFVDGGFRVTRILG